MPSSALITPAGELIEDLRQIKLLGRFLDNLADLNLAAAAYGAELINTGGKDLFG